LAVVFAKPPRNGQGQDLQIMRLKSSTSRGQETKGVDSVRWLSAWFVELCKTAEKRDFEVL